MQHTEELPATARPNLRRSRWVLVPPPLSFALPLVGATWLHTRLPIPLLPGVAGRALGILVLLVALYFIPTAPILFALHKTTIVPHGQPHTLIERGPYRSSRNPMYVGLVLLYLGVTCLMGSAWPLLFLALPIWVLQTKTIPFEERALERVFGDAYLDYARRVRRWL